MHVQAVAALLRNSESSTADTVAAVRALHQRQPLRIFEDPYAHQLCGSFWRLVLRIRPLEWMLRVMTKRMAATSMCVVMRARYAEQALEQAVADGITQYVIIGAGMDSFAFRRPDLMERIDVFEIDHPVTQRKKLARMHQAGLTIPSRMHVVPADLEKVSVLDALAGSGFEVSRPTFLTLLGVAYYLTADSLSETARSVSRRLPEGTRLVIDYLLPAEAARPEDLPMREQMMSFVERLGEPMVSAYSRPGMQALMAAQGFETSSPWIKQGDRHDRSLILHCRHEHGSTQGPRTDRRIVQREAPRRVSEPAVVSEPRGRKGGDQAMATALQRRATALEPWLSDASRVQSATPCWLG